MKTLVIDVGGTNIKLLATGRQEVCKIPSGPEMTADGMMRAVLGATHDWDYEVVSIGYPGPVVDGRPLREPYNLGEGWIDLDYQERFGRSVKLINDAAMQAIGSYQGGRMLFLGLGTGLGSAMVVGKSVMPLELAHLPYRKGRTFEDYVGLRGLERLGKKMVSGCSRRDYAAEDGDGRRLRRARRWQRKTDSQRSARYPAWQ